MTWDITSQLLGLFVTMGLTSILLFALYWFVIRKQSMGQAPTNKLMVLLESYYEGFNNLINGLSGGKHGWANIYLFTLFNFIMLNSMVSWIGLEPAPTSIMFTLPLAIITFIGIFIIGIGTLGVWGFIKHKYANPLELVLQFAPVISMSVRLFAATFAGAIIGNVPWIVVNGLTSDGQLSDISAWTPALQILVMWVWRIIDMILSLIQAFVFISLTIIFWVMESGTTWSSKERKRIKEEQRRKESGNLNIAEEESEVFENQTTAEALMTINTPNGEELINIEGEDDG